MAKKRRRESHATVSYCDEGAEPPIGERPRVLRSVDDIDSRDADNPSLVTCYVDEMYDHFLELELRFRVSNHYMLGQRFIDPTMRSILVDSLVLALSSLIATICARDKANCNLDAGSCDRLRST